MEYISTGNMHEYKANFIVLHGYNPNCIKSHVYSVALCISKALYVLDYEIIMCNNAHYLPLERWNDCKEDSRFHVQLLPPAV